MLEVKNLSVGYDDRYVIRNVNLTFEPGMIYTIIGKKRQRQEHITEKLFRSADTQRRICSAGWQGTLPLSFQ